MRKQDNPGTHILRQPLSSWGRAIARNQGSRVWRDDKKQINVKTPEHTMIPGVSNEDKTIVV
ncbi:hypothetical protein A2303_06335 [Candidatus Falkowbacteria bacterium RIFOXYB2_FULL_47_14]|uniref:Uncharacterized protein n=1 Tax=Candidatus Falkowbacteria bacterium RIFOXYA2_FULL_47_19 TaxID=1797994 RepID=A0A1F5SKG5_9BACT|nr:MAG: hypothetical protein A2227_06010 [Candidatus Falkowbacteria bacterium RIFOXYA2_FULL_47_19]OGF35873.1 MAG: hypothetical protein A2468_04885 [Candidatus Falkowbacteria bacterium RIFOXYC2_FULL_46_15]OGF43549.1 MAG: hypothetical protein A2303_06335 [Candidatus Falkowbacteria bacterium RIFOXYB2_FULL_47_14]